MKYILMMNTMKPVTGFPSGPQKDLQAHIAFMMNLNKELRESGELVSAEGSVISRSGQTGAGRQEWHCPLPTASFLNPRSFSRATGSSMSRRRSGRMRSRRKRQRRRDRAGTPLNMPIEVRPVMSGPPPEML